MRKTISFLILFIIFYVYSISAQQGWFQQVSGISSDLNAVDFFDEINGLAVGDGGIILKTTNGGTN